MSDTRKHYDWELADELLTRAKSYRESGPSSEHTATLLERAAGEIERLALVARILRSTLHTIDHAVRNPDTINALLERN